MARLKTYFIHSAAFLLIATALLKILSVLLERNPKYQYALDPLFGFRNWQVLTFGVLAEVITLVQIFIRKEDKSKLGWILWLSTTFLAYRVSLWIAGYPGTCACLGTWLPIGESLSQSIAKGILLYLLLGSMVFLYNEFKNKRDQSIAAETSFNA